jgi:hypothetical protein
MPGDKDQGHPRVTHLIKDAPVKTSDKSQQQHSILLVPSMLGWAQPWDKSQNKNKIGWQVSSP